MIVSSIYFKLLFVLLVISISNLYSQPFTRELNSVDFLANGKLLSNTFSGGQNNIEPQFIDWDNDGDLDIVFLDSDGTFGVYLNIGNKTNPEFELVLDNPFGLFLKSWFYFADMDNDGDFDYFTNGAANSIDYYENTGSSTNPSFTKVLDTLRTDNGIPIFTDSGSNPFFIDIDNDGDTDLLSGNQTGTVTFYKNIGNVNDFRFILETDRWQDIEVIGGGLLSKSIEHHGASSIDFGNITGNEAPELLWGDFFSRSLYYFDNQGTLSNPVISLTSEVFPQNANSVFTSGFNMPRLADIDGDNDLDLFVSVLFDPTVPQSLIFYENIGSTQSHRYILRSNDYLSTLDVGTKSIPALVDIDNDGDLDLFIGNEKNPKGSIAFFRNEGSATNLQFSLIDSAYFNIEGDLSIAPHFGDIDGDGDFDLLVGKLIKTIDLYENTGNSSEPIFSYRGILKDISGGEIEFGNFLRPLLTDLDNDNDLDLLIGGSNGKLKYYLNVGSSANYSFELNESLFEFIDVGNNSAPSFADIDNDGDYDLFVGNRSGQMFYFRNMGNVLEPQFELESDNYLEGKFGADISPFFSDIDSDSDKDLFIGNLRGGILFFRNTTVSTVTENDLENTDEINVSVFPNPFNLETNITVSLSARQQVSVEVFDILGRKVRTLTKGITKKRLLNLVWNGRNERNEVLSSGVYLIRILTQNKINSVPIILSK